MTIPCTRAHDHRYNKGMPSGKSEFDSSVRPPTPARPRWGVAQLLIWIGCIGALLAILRAFTPREPKPRDVLVALPLAASVGAAWAGAILLALRAAWGERWPIEPGHWLLALLAAGSLLALLLHVAPDTLFSRTDVVLNAVLCWLLVLPLFSKNLNERWRAFFLFVVFAYAAPLVLGCAAMLGVPTSTWVTRIAALLSFAKEPVAAGAAISTSLLDLRAGQRRDWLHWCGVIIFVSVIVVQVALVA